MLIHDGAYFYQNKESKYSGLFFPESANESFTLFKTIENIDYGKVLSVTNKISSVIMETDLGDIESYFWENSFVIQGKLNGDIILTLDMRHIYDFDDQGRIYSIFKEKDCIIVEYKKYEDNSLAMLKYV